MEKVSVDIARLISDRNGESICLSGLGNAYNSLGYYQKAIECYQQSLKMRKENSDRSGEANVWFNLGLVLEKTNQEAEAIIAYRHARKIYQTMGFNSSVQDCNDAIELLKKNTPPVSSGFRYGSGVSGLWQLIKSWFDTNNQSKP